MNAGVIVGIDTGGTFTDIVAIAGGRLHVNAAVAPGGELRAAILDADATPIAGLTADRCTPITGDVRAAGVSWAGGSDLRAARDAHEHVRVAFTMRRAALYAWWIA